MKIIFDSCIINQTSRLRIFRHLVQWNIEDLFYKKKNKYLRGIKTKFPLLVSRVHRETASGISRETGGRAKVSGANDTARRRFYPLWTRQAEKRSDGVTFFFFF